MVSERYLLYIDILGFSELVKTGSDKLHGLFTLIDSLNAHKHGDFQTIVFSDTIIVFNKAIVQNQHDHEYIVMYACEFVQDLLHRCIELEIQFRAILTYGEFQYEKLANIETYHGKALIDCYHKEKNIDAIGLFIDKKILKYNRYFASAQFDIELQFIYLTKSIERLYKSTGGEFHVDSFTVEQTFDLCDYPQEVMFLKILKINLDSQINSKIRSKYLHTYHYYKSRYSNLIERLEDVDFDFRIISPGADWSDYNLSK